MPGGSLTLSGGTQGLPTGQYPVSALSESDDKPDHNIHARREFATLDFRKLSLADPQKCSKLFLEHSVSELTDP